MADETTDPYRTAAEVPAMPDDAAMAAAEAHAAQGYPAHGAAAATAVGWQRGWDAGYAAGREAAAQAIEGALAAREADGCTYIRIGDVRQAIGGGR